MGSASVMVLETLDLVPRWTAKVVADDGVHDHFRPLHGRDKLGVGQVIAGHAAVDAHADEGRQLVAGSLAGTQGGPREEDANLRSTVGQMADGTLELFVGTPDTGGEGFVVNCPSPIVAPNDFAVTG